METNMRAWEICRTLGTALVITGLVFPSPIAWAQVEAVVDFHDAAIETALQEAIVSESPELARECLAVLENAQDGGPEVRAITGDIEAAVEATATLEEIVTDSAAVTATVTQALQTTGASQTAVTDTVAQVQGTMGEVQALLAEGATLADPRVEGLLAELASTFAEAGVNPEAFGAVGGDAVASDFFSAMAEHGDVFAAAIETHVSAEMREALASGGGGLPSTEQMREYVEMCGLAGVNPEAVMTEAFREHFGVGETGFGPGGTTPDFEALAAAGVISPEQLAEIQAGFQAMEQGYEQMHMEMMAAAEQYGAMPGFEAAFAGHFEAMAMEMGAAGMTPEQIGAAMEHYATDQTANAADAAASYYSSTQDTQAPGSGGYVAPGGGTAHVETPPGSGQWDSNADGIADHTHAAGTAAH